MRRATGGCRGPLGAVALAAGLAAWALAADWPQFRGPGRDASAPGARLPAAWPRELKVRWKIALGGGFSSPAVAGGRVFALSQEGPDEVVRCLDAADGRELWRHAYAAEFQCSWGGGPRATPTVDEDRVYTVGGTGEMYCLRTADGKTAWSKSFTKEFRFAVPEYGYAPSPLVDGATLYVHVGGRDGDSVVALEKATGKVVWKSLSDPTGYGSPMMAPASASRGPRQLVVFTEHALVSLDPRDGRENWRYPWTTEYQQNIAQPIMHDDMLFFSTLTGAVGLRLMNEGGRATMREAWRNRELILHFSCAVGRDGYVYGPHGRGAELRCVEMATGRLMWSERIPARQRAGVLLADGKLIVYTDTGELIVREATPARAPAAARLRVAGQNWVPPVVAQGCLFLRDHDSLRCLELEAPGR